MKIGPKYKIARRLGAPVFEKTQTQKYVLSQSKKDSNKKSFRKPKSNFGIQLLEKQKARYTYGLSEKQFSKYAKAALAKKGAKAVARLFEDLELRADNVVYRSGFVPTRLAARQAVSHGHFMINGKKITVPSYRLRVGDKITLRTESKSKPLFATLDEKLKEFTQPSWIKFSNDNVAEINGMPKVEGVELLFDINTILEFYSR